MNYEVYKNHIVDLCERINMPQEYMPQILKNVEIMCSDKYEGKYHEFEDSYFSRATEDWHEIAPIHEFAKEIGVEGFLLTLSLCLMYSLRTLRLYRERCIPVEIYYDSFIDLVIWSRCCEDETGVFGILNYGWVGSQITLEIFRLGRMQFHQIKYSGPEFEHAGVRLKKGDTVINTHIPEGDALTKDKRLDAYRRAYKFFNQTGNAVFVCDSWLLHAPGEEYLPEKSNIRDFMKDFHIVSSRDRIPPYEMHDLWRVFGHRESYADTSKLPQNSSIQRAYAARIDSGKSLGAGLGVFIFDGENIL